MLDIRIPSTHDRQSSGSHLRVSVMTTVSLPMATVLLTVAMGFSGSPAAAADDDDAPLAVEMIAPEPIVFDELELAQSQASVAENNMSDAVYEARLELARSRASVAENNMSDAVYEALYRS
jgi:hypothetical protein